MAKNFTHLKPSVYLAYDQGKSVLEVIKFFKIPKSTAYDWHKEHRELKFPKPTPPKNPEPPQQHAPLKLPEITEAEILEPRPFTVINGGRSGEELSDFQLARKVLREIALDASQRDATRLQAAVALLRLPAMKAEIPKHVLEESGEVSTLASERKKLENMSAEVLAREYQKLIEGTREY